MHDEQMEIKAEAERVCQALNARLGWRGANPEFIGGRYTGRIVLSPRAAQHAAQL